MLGQVIEQARNYSHQKDAVQTPVPHDSPDVQEGIQVVQDLKEAPSAVTPQQTEKLEKLLKRLPA